MERMNALKDENTQLRNSHKDQLENQIETTKNDVSQILKSVTVNFHSMKAKNGTAICKQRKTNR